MSTATVYAPQSTHSIAVGYIFWVLGIMGLHRFYYGKPITGLIWLFTGGLCLIGWIVDAFLIPQMDAEADGKYALGPLDYTVAWLLLVFLGIFGAHRLYMGKIVTGIIWLLTGGLLGLGLLYDLCTLNDQVHEINSQSRLVMR